MNRKGGKFLVCCAAFNSPASCFHRSDTENSSELHVGARLQTETHECFRGESPSFDFLQTLQRAEKTLLTGAEWTIYFLQEVYSPNSIINNDITGSGRSDWLIRNLFVMVHHWLWWQLRSHALLRTQSAARTGPVLPADPLRSELIRDLI